MHRKSVLHHGYHGNHCVTPHGDILEHVMCRPVWSFMEREVADDQLCWTTMNPGYQGEELIDGT